MNIEHDPKGKDPTAEAWKNFAKISNPKVWNERQKEEEEKQREHNDAPRRVSKVFSRYTDRAKESATKNQDKKEIGKIRKQIEKDNEGDSSKSKPSNVFKKYQ